MELRIPSQVSHMTNAEIQNETFEVLAMIKAALVRSVRENHDVIDVSYDYDDQGNEIATDITWDFTKPENLAYVDDLHCRNARMYLREAERRNWPDVAKIMGPQVVYALNNGGVSRRSFAEITAILYPPPRETCKVMAFAARPAANQPTAAPAAQETGRVVAFAPRAPKARPA